MFIEVTVNYSNNPQKVLLNINQIESVRAVNRETYHDTNTEIHVTSGEIYDVAEDYGDVCLLITQAIKRPGITRLI